MKILMVNKFLYPRGGSESYMLYLAEHLKNMGHEIEFFGMYDENNTVGNSKGMYTQNMDFHSKGLSRFLYPFKIIFSFEAKKKIMQVIDDFKPDIVHMNNINFQLTPSIIYGIKKKKIPLVQTVHDYQMICPNHLLYNFKKNVPCEKCVNGSYINCIKNKCIHNSTIKSILGVIEAKFYSLFKTYKKVDLFVCPSNFLENKLLSAKKFYKGKTKTIHNFIDKEKFAATSKVEEDYIVFVGRLSKEKGIENIAGAAKLLSEYNFVVAGSGPDEDVLKGIPNIKLAGFLNGDELTYLMGNAKVLILPSVCYENCPLSILEAHSMGVPVVTMNSGGMAELVKNGVTGTLVNEPTPKGIALKIKETIENEDYYNSLKENCKNEKDNILSVKEYADILIKEYQKLIAR
ncbi:MAG: glycosyltransferase [Ruminococcaceae bacterium]|nr:glycosyltransferase [Oscillospiraceae bacterium]